MVKNVIILGLLVLALGRGNFRPFPEYEGHFSNDHSKIDEEISRRPKIPRPPQGDFRPVIGILSVPIFPYNTWNTTATTYLAASYIKYVEMGGARVVPIRSDSSFAELDFLFPRLNGILFPGGTIYMFDNSTYPVPTLGADFAAKACYLYNKVKQANDNGIYYPLWGTCMGFETIQVCENIEYATLGNFNGEPAYIRSNNFTKLAKDSYIFEALGKHYGDIIRDTMSKKETSLLSHIHGVSTSMYTYQNNLTNFYNVLSTMHDKSGSPFISMIEAKNYPIYGTQFHPEKNIYEWEPTSPQPHDPFSVMVSTYFANFLASEARRNNNTFVSEQELEPYLIYNYSPLYTNNYFTQTYEF